MALPTFLIIGAMKAGTTSLHGYLKLHPDIYMTDEKEVDYYFQPERYDKGLDWYKSLFDANYDVRGETSPNYSKRKEIPLRIKNDIPDVKLIYLTRHPVERFLSECNHLQLNPNEIIESKDFINHKIFKYSLYYSVYAEFSKYFAEEQLLVIKSEDLRAHQSETLKRIFKFLGVSEDNYDFDNPLLHKEEHITSEKVLNTNFVNEVNKNRSLNEIKKKLAAILPFFRPLWRRIAYKKRVIRTLTDKNYKKLNEAFSNEMRNLKEHLDIDYGY